MRRLVLLAALLPLAASAQRGRPIAEQGDVALVAQLSPSGGLGIVPALGGIGVRYRVTDRSVIGTSVGLGYQVDDTGAFEVTGQRLSVALWNENHIGRGRGVVSPFVGIGVLGRLSDADSRTAGPPPPSAPPPVQTGASESTQSLAAAALLGAEVRLARGVTLGAAFTAGVEVGRRRQTRRLSDGTAVRAPDVNALRIGTGVTDLVLSVYF